MPFAVRRLDAILTRERLRVYPFAIVGMYSLFWVMHVVRAPSSLLPDFLARWTAGAMVADGHTAALYSPIAQSVIQRSEGAHSLSWFVSPPPVALFFVPFGVVPYAAAAILWLIISVCGLVMVARLVRPYWPADRWPYWSAVLMAVASQPVIELVGGGQDSWLVLLSFVVSWRLWLAGRSLGAGVALAPAALVKPQLVLPIIVLLVLHAGLRMLCGLVLAGVGCVLGSAALLGPHVWSDWVHTISSSLFADQVTLGQAYKAASLQGFLTAISPAGARAVAAQLGLVAGLALLIGWAVWLVRCRPPRSMVFSTATFVAVLAAPHAMIYDLVIALPGIAAVIVLERRPTIRVVFAAGFIAAWLGPPLSFLRSGAWPISALSAQWVVPVLVMVTLQQMFAGRLIASPIRNETSPTSPSVIFRRQRVRSYGEPHWRQRRRESGLHATFGSAIHRLAIHVRRPRDE